MVTRDQPAEKEYVAIQPRPPLASLAEIISNLPPLHVPPLTHSFDQCFAHVSDRRHGLTTRNLLIHDGLVIMFTEAIIDRSKSVKAPEFQS